MSRPDHGVWPQPDGPLVKRLQTGEPSAFAEAFDSYSGRLYRVALGVLHDTEEANDVVQQAFIRLFEKIGEFEGRSRLGTWLYRVAYNEALMRLRAAKPSDSIDELLDDATSPLPRRLVDWSDSPEYVASDAELGEELETAIATLPETLRAAFLLRDVEGLSTAEAAEVLEIGTSALKVRLHRARLILRERLAAVRGGAVPLAADGLAVSCEDVIAHLSDYLDHDLAGTLRGDVEDHIAHCGACRVALDTTRHTIALYERHGRHVVLPDREALYARLRAIFEQRG